MAFASRRRGCSVANQALQERLEIYPVVEPVREGAEVMVGVLAETERLVATASHHLEVAQDGVDPGELRQVARLALADYDIRMSAARVDDAGKAAQTVAANVAARQQIGFGPVADGLPGKLPTAASFTRMGRPASLVDTAATMGTLFGDPRPPTPGCSPPR